MTDMTPTPAPAVLPPLPVVAWLYQCWTTAHVLNHQNDHYFSVDDGETKVKGEPLVKLSDALAAISAQQVPPGWQLVPVEPTAAMLTELSGEWHPSRHAIMKIRWPAMLAATPQPAQQEGQKHLAGVPDGWQLVPKVPTPHMLFMASNVDGQSSKMSRMIWEDMLAAAPTGEGA